MKVLKKSLVILCLSCLIMPLNAMAASSIGTIVSITGTASILRNGKLLQAFLKDDIHVGDTLITSANKANMRIWLEDDTIITLAPDTEFAIPAYVDDKKRSIIATRLNKGVVKIYSGDIVHNYPNSFTLKTSDGLVQLRQGIATIKSNTEVTSVFAEISPSKDVLFNDKVVPSGHKANITSRHLIPDVTVITLFDREILAADFATKSYEEIALDKYLDANSSNNFINYKDNNKISYANLDEAHRLRVMDNYFYTIATGKNNALENMDSEQIVDILSNDYYDDNLQAFALASVFEAPIPAPVSAINVRMGSGDMFGTNYSLAFTLNIVNGNITDATMLTSTGNATGGTGKWTFDYEYDGNGNVSQGSFNIDKFDGGSLAAPSVSGTLASSNQSFEVTEGIYTTSNLSSPTKIPSPDKLTQDF